MRIIANVSCHQGATVPEQELSSLAPIDIGRMLALSLDHSCKIEQISAQERSLLSAAKIPVERYFTELVVLAGFAQDYAIVKLLGNGDIGKQVRDGYLEVWSNVGKKTPAGAAVFRLFIQRCPEYAKAAERMQPGEAVNSIGLTFGGFLASGGDAQMLAIMYAPEVYFAHFEGAAELLQQAKLIKKSDN